MRCEDLTEPELLLWKAFPSGALVDLRSGNPTVDDPARGGSWDDDRIIRAEVIRAILLGACERETGAVAALRVTGARISGRLDLMHAEVRFPVHLVSCWFETSPDLCWAMTRHLDLTGSHLPGLLADDLRVEGQLVLTGCRIGSPQSPAAEGNLADLRAPGRPVSATGIKVSGGIFMNGGFTAAGEVRLLAGQVGGVLDLGGAQLRNRGGVALLAARLTVDGPVFCRDGFTADGQVTFRRAHITGFIDLSGARLSDPGGQAFYAPMLTVDSGMFCSDGTVFSGEVTLTDARILGSLTLSGARLDNPGRAALSASRLRVDGPLFFRYGFTADGEVVLRRAHVTSFLDTSGARLSNPGGHAFFAPGITVEGGITFRESTILQGQVSLEEAQVTGDLDLSGAGLSGPEPEALNCAHLTATRMILPPAPVSGTVNLSHARIGTLTAYPDGTPAGINVNELSYETLVPMVPASQRVSWITGAQAAYLPQPYEQLAASYRRLGHDADARTVLLAKQRHRHRSLALPLRVWGLLQDITIGYGYRPGRASIWLVALVATGTIVFGLHHPPRVQNAAHIEFNSFFYTLDLMLPVISYGQESQFAPTGFYQWLSYAFITAGWILATTIITAISRVLYRN
jgi:hypothetical protein